MRADNFKQVSKLLPSTIPQAIEQPPVSEWMKVVGGEKIYNYLEFELIKLSTLVSVGGSFNSSQVEFIAGQLIELFPNESLADFKICFSRGAMGQYGDIFRMDGIIIRGWMEKYLDEKYRALEDKLMKEKEASMYAMPEPPPTDQPNATDWYQKWLDAAGSAETNAKKVRPMTDEEIMEEGQVKPKRKVYVYDHTEAGIYATERLAFLRECQERTVRERHPDWTEQQILDRVEELQKEEVTKSGTHSILGAAKKIRARY